MRPATSECGSTRGGRAAGTCLLSIGGYLAARDLIASRTLYTTLFTSDDGSAMGVIRALREHDLSVPRDVSVVGFGDHVDAAAYTPRLTTVRVPSQQAGERAAQMIVGRIESGTAQSGDRSSPLNAVFSVRESTGFALSRARNGAG